MKKTARAHTNIALIKYWGKSDEMLHLPLMSSISMTLDAFYTDTSFERCPKANEDIFFLNDQRIEISKSQRVITYVHRLQNMFGLKEHFRIDSTNHVPTSAGLASSASAFAALAASFAKAYHLDCSLNELSRLARLGSGSASRSIFGGFVEWQKGHDNMDSFAIPINEAPKLDLCLLAVEVDAAPKKLASSVGMKKAQGSPFFPIWLKQNETEIAQMRTAIAHDDFDGIGKLAEQNANEMHAINLTARPGFTYFEPDTIKVIQLVHQLREEGIDCYYTIDAGPNVKILCQLRNHQIIQERLQKVLSHVKIVFAQFGPGITYLD